MADLASLQVSLDLQTAAFERGISQATASMARMEANSKKTSNSIASLAGNFAKVGAAAAAAGLANMAKSLIDAADAAQDVATAFGTSIDRIYAYQQALVEAGGKADAMANGLQKLADQVDNAFSGSDAAVAAFERLGISMQSMKNQKLDTIFERVAAALAKETDEVKRNALAKELLGKSLIGVEFEKFNAQIEASAEKYKALQPYLESAAELSDALAAKWKSFTTYLTAGAGALYDTVKKIGQGFKDIYNVITGNKPLDEALALPQIAAAAEKVAPAINRIAEATAAQKKAAADAAKELENWNKEIAKQVQTQIQWESTLLDSLNPMREIDRELQKLQVALDSGRISWEQYADGMFKITSGIDTLKQAKEPLDEIGVAIGQSLQQGVAGLVSAFGDANKSFGEFAANFLKSIAQMIAQTLILATIKKSLAGTSLGGFLGFANGGAFKGATGLPHGIYDKPTFFQMPGQGLHKFAKGGALGVLGEAGAEAILPLARGAGGKLGVKGTAVNVVVNNNAPGVEVTTEQQGDNIIMTIEKVKAAIMRDLRQGGNAMSQTMERTYGLGRAGGRG